MSWSKTSSALAGCGLVSKEQQMIASTARFMADVSKNLRYFKSIINRRVPSRRLHTFASAILVPRFKDRVENKLPQHREAPSLQSRLGHAQLQNDRETQRAVNHRQFARHRRAAWQRTCLSDRSPSAHLRS